LEENKGGTDILRRNWRTLYRCKNAKHDRI